MNRPDTLKLIGLVRMLWPHSRVGEDLPEDELLNAWHTILADTPLTEATAVVERLARAGREHAPPVGVIAAGVDRRRHGEAPSFEDAMAQLVKFNWCLPYRPEGANPPDDLVVCLDAMQRAGAPEILQRLVAALGVYAVRMMPDGSRYPLDPNQRAVRRDYARQYTDAVVPAWRQDPRPGLALARAVRAFGEVPESRRLEPPPVRRLQIAPPEPVPVPGEPMVDFVPATRDDPGTVGRLLAEGRAQRARERAAKLAAEAAERARDREATVAAERELAEHAQRREGQA